MNTFEKNIKLEETLISLSKKIPEDIHKKAQIDVPNYKEKIIKDQYFLFLEYASRFFSNRGSFVIKIISSKNFNNEEKGILKTIFRGLIEIIAKIEFAKNDKEKFVKSYLWDQLKVQFLCYFLELQNKNIKKNFIGGNFFYNALKNIDSSIPPLKILLQNYIDNQNSLLKFDKNKNTSFSKLENKLRFPSVKYLISNYWSDMGYFTKSKAYEWYNILSNPIHANVIFEGVRDEVETIDYQLLSFLMIVHLKFLDIIKIEISQKLSGEIENITRDIVQKRIEFLNEYKFKKIFLNLY